MSSGSRTDSGSGSEAVVGSGEGESSELETSIGYYYQTLQDSVPSVTCIQAKIHYLRHLLNSILLSVLF